MSDTTSKKAQQVASPTSWMPTLPDNANTKNRFLKNDLDLLESGNFADVEVTCGDRTWKLHKSIICQRCDYFRKAFTGGFVEAGKGSITIRECAPAILDVAIKYIYSGGMRVQVHVPMPGGKSQRRHTDLDVIQKTVIDISGVSEAQDGLAMAACVRTWVMADFLVSRELQEDAISLLQSCCEQHFKVLWAANSAATQSDFDRFIGDLTRAVHCAYDDLPHAKPCQRVLVDCLHALRLRLLRRQACVKLLKSRPDFGHDVFMAIVEGRENKWVGKSGSEYRGFKVQNKCTTCQTQTRDGSPWFIDNRGTTIRDVAWHCEDCVSEDGYPWENAGKAEDGH